MALVLRNGSAFDGERHRPGHGVVVEGARIVALAPDDGLPRGAGDTEVDLAGGVVAPGFVDAHVHAVQGGLERVRCDLSELPVSRDAYLAAIREYADAHPDRPWILGGGWGMAAFPGGTPTAADLDGVVPDRPVFLPNRDHHGAWVNSRALELAGLDAGSPDPADGRLERDADGRPTGTLHEGAMDLVVRIAPSRDDEEYYRGFLAGQTHLHSLGVTGWQDAILGDYGGIDDPSDTYLRAAVSGDLTASVVGALWWDRDRGAEQIPDLVRRRETYTHGRLRAGSVKVMQDGVAENFTAALGAPYLDRCGHATDNRGHSFVDGEALREYVVALAAEGFQVHVHAIGDRGVREALDAFERARGIGGDLRHHIAHLQVVDPVDVPRFAELDVTANMQALWACLDEQMIELTLPFLGEERGRWQYPFGSLHRSGARLAAGSDWPVSSPDPWAALHVAVNRTAYGEEGPGGEEPFLPEQALDLATAWSAATAGSARVCHRDRAGRLAAGHEADLVVLDRDPFAGPAAEIGSTRVLGTWVAGRQVHG
ncbi:amidohydrolase [Nocardioides sp.]|uniref:amidohydrolase n=1 Tax=Nocardioides sp. TaxID=35761 RepID=UPI0035294380